MDGERAAFRLRRPVAVVEMAVAEVRVGGGGAVVALRLTVRLEAPGDPCAPLSIGLPFEYGPGVSEGARDALDRRLYDAIYRAVDEGGGLPPEGLKVAVTALTVEPALASALESDADAALVAIGAALDGLLAEAFGRARTRLEG